MTDGKMCFEFEYKVDGHLTMSVVANCEEKAKEIAQKKINRITKFGVEVPSQISGGYLLNYDSAELVGYRVDD